MQKSLSLPTFKRKQLRHEPYPSLPPPPLGPSFLPLSWTDTQSVFFVQSQDTFIQHCVQPTSTPTTPAVPFPFLSLSFLFPPFACYLLYWHCPLISYLATNVGAGTHRNMRMQPEFIAIIPFGLFSLSRFCSFVFCETVPHPTDKSP